MDIGTKVPGLSHISKDIFKLLEKESLLECRLVNKTWNNSLNRPIFWLKKSENEYHFSRESGNLSKEDFQTSTDNINRWRTLVVQASLDKQNQVFELEKDFALVLMKIFQTCPKKRPIDQTWFKKMWKKYFSLKKNNSVQHQPIFQTFPKDLDIVVKLGDAKKYPDLVKSMLRNSVSLRKVEAFSTEIRPDQVAAFFGFTDVFKFLTKRDNLKNSKRSIHFASHGGHLDTVKYLAGSYSIGWETPITTLKDGSTPLHFAARNGHLNIVKFLARLTDNPNAANMKGWTPIHNAAWEGHIDILKFLAKFTDNPNAADQRGNTPILIAAKNGHLDIVKFLVDFTHTPNGPNNVGWTPIHTASKHGHRNIVKFLVNFTDNPNALSNGGWTPMRLANKHGHFKLHTFLAFHLLKKKFLP